MDSVNAVTHATLLMYVVTHNPSDFPDKFVVRKWRIHSGGCEPTAEYETFDKLDEVRQKMREHGKSCLARHPMDDPVIVETWL